MSVFNSANVSFTVYNIVTIFNSILSHVLLCQCTQLQLANTSLFNCITGRYKTPTKTSQPCGDRFIPNRFSTDFETAHHKASQNNLAEKDNDGVAGDSNLREKEEYEKVMSANLNGDQPNRILAFQQKAPAAPEGAYTSLLLL